MLLAVVVFVAMAACVEFPSEFTFCIKATLPDGSTTCVDTVAVVVETPP
jgi:hypothetical protein